MIAYFIARGILPVVPASFALLGVGVLAALFLQGPAAVVLEIYNGLFNMIFGALQNIAGDALYSQVQALDSDGNVVQTAATRDGLEGSPSRLRYYPSSLGHTFQDARDFFRIRINGTTTFITTIVVYYAIELIILIKLLKGYHDRGKKMPKITQRFQ